jgi:hypothetical protein
MPLNSRLKDNATVLILHNLQMSVELSHQPGEHDAGTIVEIASAIWLDNLIDDIKGCYHHISVDDIPPWNDWPVCYSGSRSCNAFLCLLSDSALRAASRYNSAKNDKKDLRKIIPMIIDYVSKKKKKIGFITAVNWTFQKLQTSNRSQHNPN